ncbi:hypothetical protein [Pseudonocardia adelaidensis]|uniref:Pecanex-like protein 1 n=1 Tax=Pseudonocardia adelaidensis TaxID=648754 RepID=A0ABP9NR52_9PSEU
MSPTSTARHSNLRKISICAAALVVTLLPTACGAAYADIGHAGHTSEVVEVGGADAAEPSGDGENDGNADDANADDANADQGDAAGGETDPAEEAPGVGDDAGADGGAQNDQGNNDGNNNDGNNQGENANNQGDEAGVAKNEPGNRRKGKQEPPPANGGGGNGNNGLDVLGTDCKNSQLEPHNGFEEAPRCVETSFGEVAAEEKSPSLLITEAPQTVRAGEDFTISVSSRNLVRDRFLGAAAGGYYLESSFLNADGFQRGHFHTACRMLESTNEAPDAAPDPEFFLATQDNGGGAGADTVKITVDGGMPSAGTAQCAVWSGDGSHRIPMMQRANQTPAFDAVRITVQ